MTDDHNSQETLEYSPDVYEKVSRRRVMQAAAAAGIGGLAGCSGDGSGDGSGNTPETDSDTDSSTEKEADEKNGGKLVDPTFSSSMLRPTNEVHFNLYNPRQGTSSRINNSFYSTFINWHDTKAKWVPDAAEDWSVDNDAGKVTLTLRDFEWWDGTPVTAKDVETQWILDKEMGRRVAKFDFIDPDSVQVTGDRTIEADLTSKVNPDILTMQAFDVHFRVKHDLYKEHREAFADATTDSEKKSVKQELFNRRIEEPYGYGLFKVTETQPQKYIGEKHEGHYASDKINDYGMEWQSTQELEGQNIQHQMVMNGDIDALMEIFVDDKFMNQVPDDFEARFPNVPIYYGRAQVINHGREPYDDVRVRKALVYLDDHTTYPDLGRHAMSVRGTRWTSLSKFVIDKFIPEEKKKLYTDYTDRNVEKATELLEDAGFSQEDGLWYKPDGNQWTPVIKATPEKAKHSRMTANNLSEVGVKAEVQTVEPTGFWSDTLETQHDYELATTGWGSIYNWHPYSHYLDTFVGGGDVPYSKMMQIESTQEIPMPIGEPDGEMQTIHVDEKVNELGEVTDKEREKELVQQLAWVYNQAVPHNPGPEAFITQYLTGDDWELPEKGDPDLRCAFPAFNLPKWGKLQAKTQ